MIKLKKIFITLLFVSILVFAGCGKSKIEILASDSVKIAVGEEKQLEYEIKGDVSNSDVSFSSNVPSILSVSNDGIIKAIAKGNVIVTIKVANVEKKIKVEILGSEFAFAIEKNDAIETIKNYLKKEDYSSENINKINSIINTFESVIFECSNPDEITALIDEYKTKLDVINTLLLDQVYLEIDKLNEYVNLNNYSEVNQKAISSYLLTAKTSLLECKSIDEIKAISDKCKNSIDQIKTLKEEKAELEMKLKEARDNAYLEVSTYVNISDYSTVNQGAIRYTLLLCQTEFSSCNSVNEINNLVNVYKTKLSLIDTTNVELNKDKLANLYTSKLEEENYQNGVIYEIFVRSFADSDGDGVGDFNGITAKLDYLNSLGIKTIWLMPIFTSPSYHGYDVINYYEVNEDYGTLEDFRNLTLEASKLGIKVMLDMVFNHTSNQSPWFKMALVNDEKYHAYYNFLEEGQKTSQYFHSSAAGSYYGYFSDSMPELNFSNEDVRDEILNISKFWIDQGVSGFRLDAVSHYYDPNEQKYDRPYNSFSTNVTYFRDYFSPKIKEYKSDFFVIGEVYEQTMYEEVARYYYGIDAPIDFPVQYQILNAISSSSNKNYVNNLNTKYSSYKKANANFVSVPFLTNHDMNRVASQLGGDKDLVRFAAEVLLTLPGSPIVYYGEELGMFGYRTEGTNGVYDETIRLPIDFGDKYTASWSSSFTNIEYNQIIDQNKKIGNVLRQQKDTTSILNVYKTLINLRNQNMALAYGNTITLFEGSTAQIQGFYREYTYAGQTQKILILHNFAYKEASISQVSGEVLYSSNQFVFDGSKIPAKSTVIIDVTGENNA